MYGAILKSVRKYAALACNEGMSMKMLEAALEKVTSSSVAVLEAHLASNP